MVASSTGFEAKNRAFSIFFYESPICKFSFKAIPNGIIEVSFSKKQTIDNGYDFSNLKKQLDMYFNGLSVEFSEPLLFNKDGFSGKVLQALRKIGFGKTITYGELASLAGFKGAARAVGSVMANNPLPLLIPCHRVILSSGAIGNFGQGKKLKEKLLFLEGAL